MFEELEKINARPKPYEFYTADELWTDEQTSEKMLAFHLNGEIDVSSRRADFIDRSVEWICSRFNVGPEVKIADFGCGPGLYASRLAQRKADVTGLDFSKRSIEYAGKFAAEKGLSINYVHLDYLEFETGDRFDLILMIMCDFCALSPVQRKTMLDKFHRLLKPAGHVLLDVYSHQAFQQREESAVYQANLLDGFWSPRKYYGFLNAFKYEDEKVGLDKYTIVEEGRTRVVYNWLQYFSPEELKREFAAAGLLVKEIYSDVAGVPFDSEANEFAVAARKV